MKKIITIACLCIGCVSSVVAQKNKNPEFKTSETGIEYRFLKNKKGVNAKVGDYVEFHISSRIGDSVIFDSRKMNNDQAVPYQVMVPAFKGDLSEGFMMMSAGDIAEFRMSVDSMMKNNQQLPQWVEKNKGLKLEYHIEFVSVRSAEQKKMDTEREAVKQAEIDDDILRKYFAKNKISPERTSSGLYYVITSMGRGPMPVKGDSVTLNYTGKFMNGKSFDSNVDPAFQHVTPLGFTLGMGMMIKGWDEGIAFFPEGTKGTLYIPSGMAYGSQARGEAIPANSIMIFDLELVDVANKTK